MFLARHLGVLEEATFLVAEYPTPSELMISFQNRALDVIIVTADDAIRLASYGQDIRIVSVLGYSEGADAIMARPDLDGVPALKGKVIGFESDVAGAYVLARALDKYGLHPRDVTLRSSRADRMNRMFAQSVVDAVVTYDPHRAALARAGARMIFDTAELPGEFVEVMVTRSEVIARQANQLRQVVDAWNTGLQYLQRNPRAAAEIVAPRDHVSPDQLLASLKFIRFAEPEESRRMLAPNQPEFAQLLKKTAEFGLKYEILPGPVDVGALRDDRIVRPQ
jgi:NitT/TauT family transport system substrate-binding protein